MNEKSIMIDLDDPRAASIAEVIGNKTCKKILVLLTQREANESEIAKELGIPLNTVGYNVKKLIDAGLITAHTFLWSVKGRKVRSYRISNQRIIISPRSGFKGVLPAIALSVVAALGIRAWLSAAPQTMEGISATSASKAATAATLADGAYATAGHAWLWFFLGALVCMTIFLIWNWRKFR